MTTLDGLFSNEKTVPTFLKKFFFFRGGWVIVLWATVCSNITFLFEETTSHYSMGISYYTI